MCIRKWIASSSRISKRHPAYLASLKNPGGNRDGSRTNNNEEVRNKTPQERSTAY
jgi:hypothetical protein